MGDTVFNNHLGIHFPHTFPYILLVELRKALNMDFLAATGVDDPDFFFANDSNIMVIVGNEEALWYKIVLLRNIYAEIPLRLAAFFVNHLSERFLLKQAQSGTWRFYV